MEKYDFVELINDNEELRAKNIFKGIHGVLVSYISNADEWIVKFLDDYNYGAYAVAKAKTKDLKYSFSYPASALAELISQINSPNFYNHTELKPPKFKEYDKVRLINDKPAYEKEGAKKGMTGCIMSSYAINGQWQVIFSMPNPDDRNPDLGIHEDDLELAD